MYFTILALQRHKHSKLEEIIRENSWFSCNICDFRSKSKKGLRIHTVKSHSVGSVNDNHNVLVRFGSGMKEDNKIKYIKCNYVDFNRNILDLMFKPIIINHTLKWKNMLRQSIKKHLMTEFLSGIADS